MNVSLLGILLVLVTMLNGCSRGGSYVEKYGVAYNAERKERKIPIIPPTWTAQDMGNICDYFDPKPDETKPHRLSKRVSVGQKGIIESETDSFYSGKTFYCRTEQMNLPQTITLTYDYSSEKTGNPWKVLASLSSDYQMETISIEEADRLLSLWGLSRVN